MNTKFKVGDKVVLRRMPKRRKATIHLEVCI